MSHFFLISFASGAYIALCITPMVTLGGPEDVGRRIGMFITVLGLGALCGPPISGRIVAVSPNFKGVGYYAGSMIVFGVFLLLVTRHLVLGAIRGKF